MKRIKHQIKYLLATCLVTALLIPVACTKDLLYQTPPLDVSSTVFWKTEDDALYALYGAYVWVRNCFDRDYYFDGLSEFMYTTGTGAIPNGAYYGASFTNINGAGNSFTQAFRYLYGGINRANYVIDNVSDRMLPDVHPDNTALRDRLEAIVGEARLLRGLCYFRLITLFGDVPGIWKTVNDNAEVSDISRLPVVVIKDSILADFTYAYEKLPNRAADFGRNSKPAALAMRGKMHLYWASWKNFGWPELAGFSQDPVEARQSYAAAAADFLNVIDNPAYGINGPLQLFRNGDPGLCDPPGKCDNLPNYYYLSLPIANGDPEFLFYFTHGGTGTGNGEELCREFAGRSHNDSQNYLNPRLDIVDHYQSTITGDFCEPVIMINENDASDPDAKLKFYTLENSAGNPKTYENRDYRMKSSIQWDYERSFGAANLVFQNWVVFSYAAMRGSKSGLVTEADRTQFLGLEPDPNNEDVLRWYVTDRCYHGLVFRKYVRNYAGQSRSDGDYNWPVVRLADVYLMYAEASNFAEDGPNAKAVELINKVRARGALPPLLDKYKTDRDVFFKAIDQERIVELYMEGHRTFDLRRWRKLEEIWGPPLGPGRRFYDTWGAQRQEYFRNVPERNYQRCYIFAIPESERNRNPNLTQNACWL